MCSAALSVSYSVIHESVIAVVLDGVLDSSTYLPVRDAIVKAAGEQPELVVAYIDGLVVPASSALAVFTSARWHIAEWPGVPLAIVATRHDLRKALRSNGITRYVDCVASLSDALNELSHGQARRRAVYDVESTSTLRNRARAFVVSTLTDWNYRSYADVAKVVVTELLETMHPAGSRQRIRLEARGDIVWIAVRDDSSALPVRSESTSGTTLYSSQGMLTSLARRWSAEPDIAGGRVVWAALGPENRI